MRLKRLELFGFKSFADRTVFEFGDDTLTGIVGPNGCGKSNVVDAIRWVLGETRAKSMRGTEMADVIFKGSASRAALSVAEVTLHIDNDSETLADRGPEVSITRRVFKSGEGEYMIDGERVRAKDVREMLFDTGMGSRGYSVLEQGKIDAVLSQNPVERRRIFEEAAGVSRYRQRKHEAELRLKRVAQDTERLDDILGELKSRIRSLKIQAGKAERYVAARDEWTAERTRLFRHRLTEIATELATFGESLRGAETRVAELRSEREVTEKEVAEREKERSVLAAELERLGSDLTRLTGEGRALDERRTHLSTRVTTLRAQSAEESQRGDKIEVWLSQRNAELDRQRSHRGELEAETETVRRAVEAHSEKRRAHERTYRETRVELEGANEAVLALLHQRTEAQNTLRHLEEARTPLAERNARAEERLREAVELVESMAAEEQHARVEQETADASLTAADGRRRELEGQAEILDQRVAEAEDERARLEVERARLSSRIESLRDEETEKADLGEGARRVLESVESGEGPCDRHALAGLLADHLSTDTEVARALDAVLGDRARALVLSDVDSAVRVAGWLREGELGLAALTLPAGLGARRGPTDLPPGDPRVVARLADRVRVRNEQRGLVEALCGDVYLARDLDAALELIALHGDLRFVTREGELVDATGLIAGHRSLTQGAIGRRARAAELEEELAPLEGTLLRATETIESLKAQRTELDGVRTAHATELDHLRHALAEAKSRLSTALARRRDLESAREHSERECAQVREELRRLETDVTAAAERRSHAEAEFERENGRLSEAEAERRRLEEERDELAREEGQARIELTRLEEQLEGSARRIADLERIVEENRAELERARRLAHEHSENAERGEEETETLAQQSAELQEARGALDSKLSELREVATAGQLVIDESRRRSDTVTRGLEDATEELSQSRLEKQRLEIAREDILTRANEELDLSEETLLADFVPEEELQVEGALAALEEAVAEMKRALDRMGPVNMEALSELEEVSERHEFLENQREDLTKSKRALDETLRTIEKESRRLFLETFEDVRANFQVIFRQLFGGGKADVILADDQDVLESGVDIVARPPGREMLSIELLSGGQRTMTALALLFAVFKSRPSPFCVLDEVDAALDDANIQRFLAMLENFRGSTQYVIVTHNKGTMADCETLYGITMETKGVSRHVSVELEDVDDFVPEVQGRLDQREAARQQAELEGKKALEDVERERAEREAEAEARRLEREERERQAALDPESGEPVVELVPPGPDFSESQPEELQTADKESPGESGS